MYLSLSLPCQTYWIKIGIPRTRTTSSAARERTTHLVCDSIKRMLEHVQTCLSTRDCLTQHPSDTLRSFRELNCRTSFICKKCVDNAMEL